MPLAAFINYLPTPLVLLTDSQGNQNVHIAPEAFAVASAELPDQIDFWQSATHGKLASVRVPPLTIHIHRGQVTLCDLITDFEGQGIAYKRPTTLLRRKRHCQNCGSFQALGTRQNGFVHFISLLENIANHTSLYDQALF